jgi:uncharacterized protein (DUF58 family)
MATGALNPTALPSHAELRSFARVAAHLLTERSTQGLGSRTVRRRAGAGLQHLDHRDYVPGDEVRHIDWRQTARRQLPVIRQFEAETSGDWFLLLDTSSSMATSGARKWAAAVSATTAMAYALLELGHRVAVVAFAADVLAMCPPGRGARHFPHVMRTLLALRPAESSARSNLAACARRLHGTASGFVVSDFLGPADLRPALAALRDRCVQLHALELHAAQDLRLPGPGPFELEDVETGMTAHSGSRAPAEAAAQAAHAERLVRLRRFTARSGTAFTAWDVALPWQRVLVDHLLRAHTA